MRTQLLRRRAARPPRWVQLLLAGMAATLVPLVIYTIYDARVPVQGVALLDPSAAPKSGLPLSRLIEKPLEPDAIARKAIAAAVAARAVLPAITLSPSLPPTEAAAVADPNTPCVLWSCTCQGFSDAFETTHALSKWGRAADRSDLTAWWMAQKCDTNPTGWAKPIPKPPKPVPPPVFPSRAALAQWRAGDASGIPRGRRDWGCATRFFEEKTPLHNGAIDYLRNVCIRPRIDHEAQTLFYYKPDANAAAHAGERCSAASRCGLGATAAGRASDFTACKVLWVDAKRLRTVDDAQRCLGDSAPLCYGSAERKGRPVLFLTAPPFNVGHQLFDALWTVFPLLTATALPRYHAVYIPWDPTCVKWLCTVLQAIHRIKYGANLPVVGAGVGEKKEEVRCFDELLLPHFSWYRPGYNNAHLLPMDNAVLLRQELTKDFPLRSLKQLRDRKRTPRIALYDHTSSKYRHWLNMGEVQNDLLARLPSVEPVYYANFGALSYVEQCRAFYDADVLLMTHGGQMANTVCARPGVKIIEVDCNWINMGSHLGRAKRYHYEMGFEYHGIGVDGINASQCSLREGHTEAMHSALHDFSLSLAQIEKAVPFVLDFADTEGGWYAAS